MDFDIEKCRIEEVIKNNECFSLKDLSVNGYDIMNLGLVQGEQIGKILKLLLQKVIDEEIDNEKSVLIDFVHDLIDE